MKITRGIAVTLLITTLAFTSSAYAVPLEKFTDLNNNKIVDYQDTGDLVAMIQTRMRELGYFHFKPTGNYQAMTRNAMIEYQKLQMDTEGKQFIADGTVGDQSLEALFSTRSERAPIAQDVHIPKGKDANGTQKQTGQATVWSEVKTKLSVGGKYTLIDFNTGVTFDVVFVGGEQHAEVECASAPDTTIMKEVFGGDFSYFKRPMLVSLGGVLTACSLQGQPHGEDTVPGNDMDGHLCLYFEESKSHVGAMGDVEHRGNITTAAGDPL